MKKKTLEELKHDKRSQWNRHWDGKHTQECRRYSPNWMCNVCKYINEPFLGESDKIAEMGLDFRKFN